MTDLFFESAKDPKEAIKKDLVAKVVDVRGWITWWYDVSSAMGNLFATLKGDGEVLLGG